MTQETDPTRYSVQQYFELETQGILQPEDRVELLEGIIVAEPPMDPPHASGITRVDTALRRLLGGRAVVRVQQPFIVGLYSAPEPDVAVVPGTEADYDTQHPTQALLIIEVAASSLPQDRLTKSRIYAAARVPEYWVINLRDRCVEVFRRPDAANRLYRDRRVAPCGDELDLVALPDASVRVSDLLRDCHDRSLNSLAPMPTSRSRR